jgi:hypothetical protein
LQETVALAVPLVTPGQASHVAVGHAERKTETEPILLKNTGPAGAPAVQGSSLRPTEHPLARAAADVQLVLLQRQRVTLEAALQEAKRFGGDRYLEETLQARLRAVNKQCAQLGDATRMHLRAIAMERDEKVKVARA